MTIVQLPFPYLADDDGVPLADKIQANMEAIVLAINNLNIPMIGTGSPETVVTASPPQTYLNRSGGAATTLFVKESGSATNTGWVGK